MIFTVEENIIRCIGDIWEGDGVRFINEFQRLESMYDSIIIKLHTNGGQVFDGNLIFNAINASKKDIEIHIIGIAASMGAVISQSTSKVYMVENGFMMIHAPSGYTYGTASVFEKYASLLRQIETNFSNKLQKITGKSKQYVDKWLVGDNWFSAEQALKEKLIAGIIEPETEVERFDPTQMESQSEVFAKFAALYIPNNVNNNSEIEMKKPIIEALGLQGVNEQSSDTAVIQAVQQKHDAEKAQIKAQLDAEKQKVADLQAKLEEQSNGAVTSLIAEAVKAGKIKKEDEATYEAIGKTSGIEALQTVFANMNVRKPIAGTINQTPDASVDRANWDFDKWQKEDPRGLEALSTSNPEQFKQLFNAKYKK